MLDKKRKEALRVKGERARIALARSAKRKDVLVRSKSSPEAPGIGTEADLSPGLDEQVNVIFFVKEHEEFHVAAKDVLTFVQSAEEESPGLARHLNVVIKGHRTEDGRLDEPMTDFLIGFLPSMILPFVTSITTEFGTAANLDVQDNDIPEAILISNDEEGVGAGLARMTQLIAERDSHDADVS